MDSFGNKPDPAKFCGAWADIEVLRAAEKAVVKAALAWYDAADVGEDEPLDQYLTRRHDAEMELSDAVSGLREVRTASGATEGE